MSMVRIYETLLIGAVALAQASCHHASRPREPAATPPRTGGDVVEVKTVEAVPCTREEWFRLFDPWEKARNLERVRECVDSGWLDAQDEWGLTALGSALAQKWLDGAAVLLAAHA